MYVIELTREDGSQVEVCRAANCVHAAAVWAKMGGSDVHPVEVAKDLQMGNKFETTNPETGVVWSVNLVG